MNRARTVFADTSALRAIAEGHEDNLFILSIYKGYDEDPLPYLTVSDDAGTRYILQVDAGGVIMASATIRPYPEEGLMAFGSICVRPECRNEGRAKTLLADVFNRAQAGGLSVTVTPFKPMGQRYLTRAFQQIHPAFPDVKIRYAGMDAFVTGERPYILSCRHDGHTALHFK
ncbi:MAG: GNAT family N-acetyltransferase [Micavibrio aeruginosavorus]|nr:GNAT family N-acetyltransferase [Micavibrio aeruginosavorus]